MAPSIALQAAVSQEGEQRTQGTKQPCILPVLQEAKATRHEDPSQRR